MLSSSSGQVVNVTTTLGGVVNGVGVLPISGTGSVSGITAPGSVIDATGSAIAGLAQPITGDRTITGIQATFTTSAALSLIGSTLRPTMQVWTSPAGDNTFTPVPGAVCSLSPQLTGLLAIGTVSKCTTTGLSIPVTSQTQAILVVRSDVVQGIDIATNLPGYWSAGLSLS